MASAIKHIFGFGGQQQQPTVINAPAPPAAPPVQQPVGTPSTNKSGNAPSFMSAAATPQQQNTSNKTLLGQ